MAHPNEELVRKGYKAFGEADMDTLRAMYAPDGVHTAAGNTPFAGDYKGADEILGYFGQLFELSGGTFKAELQTVAVEGDNTVVALHRNKGERNGKTLDQDETLTFTIEGGLFTQITEHHSDPEAYEAFWS